MNEIRLDPDHQPPWASAITPALAGLVTRSVAMGVLEGAPVTRLDAALVRRLVRALQQHRIGGDAGAMLAPLAKASESAPLGSVDEREMVRNLGRLSSALEDSATPQTEWATMRAIFGDELLVQLLGVAASSLRRYAAAERSTPDDVAARLHWLALVVADLTGAYNEFGIRRWFQRPRSRLGGKSPQQLLGAGWSPDHPAAHQVRQLAAVLSGPQTFAA